jgi:hypothetical protein
VSGNPGRQDSDRRGRYTHLVWRGGDEWPSESLGDLLLLLLRLLGRGAVGVEVVESGEEDEAAERGAGGVEHELLHKAGGRLRRPHPGPNRGGGEEGRGRIGFVCAPLGEGAGDGCFFSWPLISCCPRGPTN